MKEKKLLDDLWELPVEAHIYPILKYSPWRQAAQKYIADLEETVYPPQRVE